MRRSDLMDEAMNWREADIRPDPGEPILMRGESGYMSPNETAYMSGRYDPAYRPLAPWLDWGGDSVQDALPEGFPKEWCYLREIP
jgi:hypothetical protein